MKLDKDALIGSDLHIGHHADFIWKARGFSSPEEHDEYELDQLSKALDTNQCVHLGDIMYRAKLGLRQRIAKIIDHKNFLTIPGNHDYKFIKQVVPEERILRDIVMVGLGGKPIILCHYPLESWPQKFRGAYHLHGHCHGNLNSYLPKRMDVSADCLIQLSFGSFARIQDLIEHIDSVDS